MKRHPLPRIAFRLLLVAGGLVVGAYVANWVAWLIDPYGISYFKDNNRYFNEAVEPRDVRPDGQLIRHRPNLDLAFRTFDFRTDAAGFRCGDEASAPTHREAAAPSPTYRVLFLGDSVTLAWGVDDEVTWIRLLEREVMAADGRALECVNGGHLMFDTVQEAALLDEVGPWLAPDLVVLTAIVNDLESTWAQAAPLLAPQHPDAADFEPPPLPSWYVRQLAKHLPWLWGAVQFRWNLSSSDTEPAPGGQVLEDHPQFIKGWPRMRGGLDRIREGCEALGCPLVVMDQTVPRVPSVQRWCEEQGVPWIDLVMTQEERARGVVNSAADAHANALGNRLQADKARAGLVTLGLVRATPGS